jgi:rubrerythrin
MNILRKPAADPLAEELAAGEAAIAEAERDFAPIAAELQRLNTEVFLAIRRGEGLGGERADWRPVTPAEMAAASAAVDAALAAHKEYQASVWTPANVRVNKAHLRRTRALEALAMAEQLDASRRPPEPIHPCPSCGSPVSGADAEVPCGLCANTRKAMAAAAR